MIVHGQDAPFLATLGEMPPQADKPKKETTPCTSLPYEPIWLYTKIFTHVQLTYHLSTSTCVATLSGEVRVQGEVK